jgi:hypothetical protein
MAFLPQILCEIMLAAAKNRLVLWIKRRIYARRGEPYRIQGQTLRYIPGSRPVRLRYKNSSNAIVRYDALQVKLTEHQFLYDCENPEADAQKSWVS